VTVDALFPKMFAERQWVEVFRHSPIARIALNR
jgi:hypothetical protein